MKSLQLNSDQHYWFYKDGYFYAGKIYHKKNHLCGSDLKKAIYQIDYDNQALIFKEENMADLTLSLYHTEEHKPTSFKVISAYYFRGSVDELGQLPIMILNESNRIVEITLGSNIKGVIVENRVVN